MSIRWWHSALPERMRTNYNTTTCENNVNLLNFYVCFAREVNELSRNMSLHSLHPRRVESSDTESKVL